MASVGSSYPYDCLAARDHRVRYRGPLYRSVRHWSVLRPWVDDQFALDIAITSLNGFFHFHGTDIIPMSQITLDIDDAGFADVTVPWTVDTEQRVINDIYEVCAQILDLGSGTPISQMTCNTFGPF